MEVQLDSIQYVHNQMKEVVNGALLKRLYVLNGVSTMENIVTVVKELIQRVRYTIFIIIEALVEQAEVIPKLVLKGPDLLQELHPILCRQ